MWAEIVFTQMTKGHLFACWRGRDDVTDFHLGVVNDNAVNQQLYQLSALSESELLEGGLQAPTKVFDAGGQLRRVQLLLGLRFQLTQLLRQAILRLGDRLPLALELVPVDHLGQVHLEQAGLLALQLCQSGSQGLLTILQRLWEPLTGLGARQFMCDEGRIDQQTTQVLPHQLVQFVSWCITGGTAFILSSTLYIYKLITDRRKQVFDVFRADKSQVSRRRSCLKKALLPESPAHECQDVVEGGVRFRIPGGLRQR